MVHLRVHWSERSLLTLPCLKADLRCDRHWTAFENFQIFNYIYKFLKAEFTKYYLEKWILKNKQTKRLAHTTCWKMTGETENQNIKHNLKNNSMTY